MMIEDRIQRSTLSRNILLSLTAFVFLQLPTNGITSLIFAQTNDDVITTIPVEVPGGIAYDPDNKRMYVIIENPNLAIIDTSINVVEDMIEVGGGQLGIAYNPDNKGMYIPMSDNITVIDTTTKTVEDAIDVDIGTAFIAYDPDNKRMYATSGFSGSITIIDATTNTVEDTIDVGGTPLFIAYDPDNKRMYVSNTELGSLTVIDTTTKTVEDTIDVGGVPVGIAYNPDNKRIYVSNVNEDKAVISIIDPTTKTVEDTIDVGGFSLAIAYNPDNKRMYAPIPGSLYIIDTTTNTVEDTVEIGENPGAIAYNPDNKRMYISDVDTNSIFVVGSVTSPPTANAGIDQTVDSGNEVQLDGSASTDSTGSPLTYSWTQTEGPTVDLSNPSSVRPSFIAPETTGDDITLTFRLVVTNEDGLTSKPDEVTIIIEAPTIPPTANAGPNQFVISESTVRLDGRGSSNPTGGILTYSWTQTEGPTVDLSNPSSVRPSFIAPETTGDDITLTFRLVVTNEDGLTSKPDEVTVTVAERTPENVQQVVRTVFSNPPSFFGSSSFGLVETIDFTEQVIEILTDDVIENDQTVCDYLDQIPDIEVANSLRDLVGCI
jgi:YVTN family beta-propeller protein